MIPAEAVPSPNIWRHPDVYELENLAVDPDGVIEAAMERIRPMAGARVLDIGCGTGFHLPRFARSAARVTGVEPHPALAARARKRVAGLDGVEVLNGVAQRLPVPDSVVEVAHARWAYFFGPGCEPGLAELDRVMRRGGVAFVIDNDATRSTFGGWFRRSLPSYDPAAVERFWSSHGFGREALTMRWDFTDRRAFEAVVGIEFPPALAAEIIAAHPGTAVDYAVNLWWRRY
ncbi:methyltransferase domain-containing protein [Nocardiopsis sp. MT53]|uniref:Methyltransferase domain-containing protein n=1 Tax=Nocardiopsis changdeensis TaxID=2831969 RepID=A0ABX8BPF1_9ACTN|nr:methyltransferase domain-containing protein [Nocardiopsis changdeensis]QYX38208.1 methyltransferase domain-containing protein [Nocardiopsis sp. MT53]